MGRGLSRPGIARCTQRLLVRINTLPTETNPATRDREPSHPFSPSGDVLRQHLPLSRGRLGGTRVQSRAAHGRFNSVHVPPDSTEGVSLPAETWK